MPRDKLFNKEMKIFLSADQKQRLQHAALDIDPTSLPESVTGGNGNANSSMLIRSWIEQHTPAMKKG